MAIGWKAVCNIQSGPLQLIYVRSADKQEMKLLSCLLRWSMLWATSLTRFSRWTRSGRRIWLLPQKRRPRLPVGSSHPTPRTWWRYGQNQKIDRFVWAGPNFWQMCVGRAKTLTVLYGQGLDSVLIPCWYLALHMEMGRVGEIYAETIPFIWCNVLDLCLSGFRDLPAFLSWRHFGKTFWGYCGLYAGYFGFIYDLCCNSSGVRCVPIYPWCLN